MKITSVLDRRSPPLLPPVTISICLFQLQNILWVSDIKSWLSFMKYGKFVRCKILCICHRVAATCMCKSTSDKGRQLLEFHLYLTVKSFINLILATILVDSQTIEVHSWYNCTFMRQKFINLNLTTILIDSQTIEVLSWLISTFIYQ